MPAPPSPYSLFPIPYSLVKIGLALLRKRPARFGAGGGPETHGNTRHRKPGSISPGTDPSRVLKGMRAAGHMGSDRVTARNLTVVIDQVRAQKESQT